MEVAKAFVQALSISQASQPHKIKTTKIRGITYIAAHRAVPALVRDYCVLVRLQTMKVNAALARTMLGFSVLQHILGHTAGAQFATVNRAMTQFADLDGGGRSVLRLAHFQRKALQEDRQ